MAGLSIIEDTYNLRARVAPSIIVVLPVMLAISSWWPGEAKWPGVLTGLGVSLALGTLLSQLGRDLGKERQVELFETWGGAPTTQLLSHRNSTLNPHTLARYHEALRQLRPDLTLPNSKDTELADTGAADAAYASCTDTLRELARDKAKYPLVFEENIGFGFRRNLWAMKPTAIIIAIGSSAACLLRTWNQLMADQAIDPAPLVFGVLCVCLFVIWTIRITPSWIRVAGFAYAERLLGICETIPPKEHQPNIIIPNISDR
jgi:hypothetical protein